MKHPQYVTRLSEHRRRAAAGPIGLDGLLDRLYYDRPDVFTILDESIKPGPLELIREWYLKQGAKSFAVGFSCDDRQ